MNGARGGSAARRRPVVVVGDALLDRDVEGRATRLCPDAPVPVVDVVDESVRPGGAGLAAVLAAQDGPTILIACVADDEPGSRLRRELEAHGVRLVALRQHRPTVEKIRVRVGSQTIVRLDNAVDRRTAVDVELTDEAIDALTSAGCVLVSDYGLGITGAPDLRQLLCQIAGKVPVVWDPHPFGASPIEGCRLVTPNEAEFNRSIGAPSTPLADIAHEAASLASQWKCAAVAVTLGPRGAIVAGPYLSSMFVPAPAAGDDACGAGDRFASAVASALAEEVLISEAVERGVAIASSFVASRGLTRLHSSSHSAPIAATDEEPVPSSDPFELAARIRSAGGTVVATGGCFDLLHAGHISMLRAARMLGDCLIVCLNSDASVRRLKGLDRPLQTQDDRAALLRALDGVDAVAIFDEDTPLALLDRLRPHIFAKGADYVAHELPETEVLARYGGRTIVLPYLPGRSTSGLVAEVINRARV
jgi:D-beta-D-heptose 7-phosphate kinase / D-beta-D-heptose 1-phosphate adenosyltransferase